MIVVDANLLVYATNTASEWHAEARAWLEGEVNAGTDIALPWLVTIAWLRLCTHPRIFPEPLGVGEALAQVEAWLAEPNIHAIEPGPRHWTTLSRLLHNAGTAGNLSNDAHLAAIAIDHGRLLCSADNDFRRFDGLQYHNPLQDAGVHEPALSNWR